MYSFIILFLSLLYLCIAESHNSVRDNPVLFGDVDKERLDLRKELKKKSHLKSDLLSYGLRTNPVDFNEEEGVEPIHDSVSAIVKREAYQPRRPIQLYRLGGKRAKKSNNETDDGTGRAVPRKRVKNRNKELNSSQENTKNLSILPVKAGKKEKFEHRKQTVSSSSNTKEKLAQSTKIYLNEMQVESKDAEHSPLRDPNITREKSYSANIKNIHAKSEDAGHSPLRDPNITREKSYSANIMNIHAKSEDAGHSPLRDPNITREKSYSANIKKIRAKSEDTENSPLRDPNITRDKPSSANIKKIFRQYAKKFNVAEYNSASNFTQKEELLETEPTENVEILNKKQYDIREIFPESVPIYIPKTPEIHPEILDRSSSKEPSEQILNSNPEPIPQGQGHIIEYRNNFEDDGSSSKQPSGLILSDYPISIPQNQDQAIAYKNNFENEIRVKNNSFAVQEEINLDNNYPSSENPSSPSSENPSSPSSENPSSISDSSSLDPETKITHDDSLHSFQGRELINEYASQISDEPPGHFNLFEDAKSEHVSPQQRESYYEFSSPNNHDYDSNTGYNIPEKQRRKSKLPKQQNYDDSDGGINLDYLGSSHIQDYNINSESNNFDNQDNNYNPNQQEYTMDELSSSETQEDYNTKRLNNQYNNYNPNQQDLSSHYEFSKEEQPETVLNNEYKIPNHRSAERTTGEYNIPNIQHPGQKSANRVSSYLVPSSDAVESHFPNPVHNGETQNPIRAYQNTDAVHEFNFQKLPKTEQNQEYGQQEAILPHHTNPDFTVYESTYSHDENLDIHTPNSHLQDLKTSSYKEENVQKEPKTNDPPYSNIYETVNVPEYTETQEHQFEGYTHENDPNTLNANSNAEYTNGHIEEQQFYEPQNNDFLEQSNFNTQEAYNPDSQSFNNPANLQYPNQYPNQENQDKPIEGSSSHPLAYEQYNNAEIPQEYNQQQHNVGQEGYQHQQNYQPPQHQQHQAPEEEHKPSSGNNYITNNILYHQVPRKEPHHNRIEESSYNQYGANQQSFKSSPQKDNGRFDQGPSSAGLSNYGQTSQVLNENVQRNPLSQHRTSPNIADNYRTRQNEYQPTSDVTSPYSQGEGGSNHASNYRPSPKATNDNINIDQNTYQPKSNVRESTYTHNQARTPNRPSPKAKPAHLVRKNTYQSNSNNQAKSYPPGEGKDYGVGIATANIHFKLNSDVEFKHK